MNEADTEREYCRWAEKLGALCLKLRIDGTNGFPDRTFILDNTFVFVEFKRYDGKLRPMQEVVLEQLRHHNCNWIVTDNLHEAIEFTLECIGRRRGEEETEDNV